MIQTMNGCDKLDNLGTAPPGRARPPWDGAAGPGLDSPWALDGPGAAGPGLDSTGTGPAAQALTAPGWRRRPWP